MKPLAIELFAGLHGWGTGLVAEGFTVVGFDIVDMCAELGEKRPEGCHLVIQDVLTLHGSQFKDAALIVASPPCQKYSYMAMPWKKSKQLIHWHKVTHGAIPQLNALFDACFRIQREACEAAGRHIPLVVENVRGAQPWVGDAKWHYGSFYLWGDMPALMPPAKAIKCSGGSWYGDYQAQKQAQDEAIKQGGDWFDQSCTGSISRRYSSRSKARKAASARIAKIPYVLANHIAKVYRPEGL